MERYGILGAVGSAAVGAVLSTGVVAQGSFPPGFEWAERLSLVTVLAAVGYYGVRYFASKLDAKDTEIKTLQAEYIESLKGIAASAISSQAMNTQALGQLTRAVEANTAVTAELRNSIVAEKHLE